MQLLALRALLCVFLAAGMAAAAEVPRITIADGRFGRAGAAFHPRGFNYIRLRNHWHDTFAPGRYDRPRAEAMLADLEKHGFNTVRIFIDHNSGSGVADKAADGVSGAYMDNVADFVGRAARHNVYVIPALLHLPEAPRYKGLLPAATATIAGGNVLYLTPGGHQAKARAAADFVAAIKARDRALLPAILAYELDNETHLIAAAAPFSLRSGIIRTADGKEYDAASQDQLQQLADDQVIAFANACVEAIRGVDPEALVSTNVFTFAAVGRSGPGRLHEDRSADRRFPARPLALARSKLSYLDIHFYPFKPDTLDRDLRSIEWETVSKACRERGLPLLMGEYGAFRRNYPTIESATEAMRAHLVRIRALGFAGDLYWTYDTDEQDYLWNGRSEGGRIMEMLAR